MTLADLRTLLTLARGPAVERVPRPTIDRLGYRYLPRSIWLVEKDGSPEGIPLNHAGLSLTPTDWLDRPLDLTDPGTVHALKVALALALGLDPGAMGVGASWRPRLRVESSVWTLHTTTGFESFVINEPDPIKALILACQHVIKGKP